MNEWISGQTNDSLDSQDSQVAQLTLAQCSSLAVFSLSRFASLLRQLIDHPLLSLLSLLSVPVTRYWFFQHWNTRQNSILSEAQKLDEKIRWITVLLLFYVLSMLPTTCCFVVYSHPNATRAHILSLFPLLFFYTSTVL